MKNFNFEITKESVLKRMILDIHVSNANLFKAINKEEDVEGLYLENLGKVFSVGDLIDVDSAHMTFPNEKELLMSDVFNILFDLMGDLFNQAYHEGEAEAMKRLFKEYLVWYFALGLVYLEIHPAKLQEKISEM